MLTKWIISRIPNHEDVKNERVRSAYGKAASMVGIGCNVLLFAGKLVAGLLSGSVAIMADAVNNLSDASSSLISLLGFKLADRPADAEHPYGHGRFEYLSGMTVAVMIVAIGVELLRSSVGKIFAPEPIVFSWVSVGVLAASIVVKCWMAAFNANMGRRIGSTTLEATASDSRNDVITTSAVLLCTMIARLTGLDLDGYVGAAVAVFILVSGVSLIKETLNPLLGEYPFRRLCGTGVAFKLAQALVGHIREKLMSYPGVLGVHDLMIHDYGPGRQFASVHVEMSARRDPIESHEVIDGIERDFLKDERLHLVVHYDPVATDDPRVPALRDALSDICTKIHPKMAIHDLRVVQGAAHVNVVFDCVVPYDCQMSETEIRRRMNDELEKEYPGYTCIATLERSYTE